RKDDRQQQRSEDKPWPVVASRGERFFLLCVFSLHAITKIRSRTENPKNQPKGAAEAFFRSASAGVHNPLRIKVLSPFSSGGILLMICATRQGGDASHCWELGGIARCRLPSLNISKGAPGKTL